MSNEILRAREFIFESMIGKHGIKFCVNRKYTFPSHKSFSPTAHMVEGLYILDIKGGGKTTSLNYTKTISDWRIMFDIINKSKGRINSIEACIRLGI